MTTTHSRVLGLTLQYSSNSVWGYKQVISIPASGSTVPANLKRIIVKLQLGGREFEKTLDPLPNQAAEFEWDGLDYRRGVSQSVTAYASIGFVYNAAYYGAGFYVGKGIYTPAFGQTGSTVTAVQCRQEVIYWKYQNLKMQEYIRSGTNSIAKGWGISNQYYISPTDLSTLVKGDKTVFKRTIRGISTVAGSTGVCLRECDKASNTVLYSPHGVAVDAAGNLLIAEGSNHRIRKVDMKGIITTVAGSGSSGEDYGDYGGDGGPATAARLNWPAGVAVDFRGNLYIADSYNNRVRKVDTRGIITTVAGNGTEAFSGDGGPAVDAGLNCPEAVAVDASGNLYIADLFNNRIRKVDAAGIITTVAGSGEVATPDDYYVGGYGGDGGPATEAKLHWPMGVAVDAQGNLYISDTWNCRIRKVNTSGTITTVAGSDQEGYGGMAARPRRQSSNGPREFASIPRETST